MRVQESRPPQRPALPPIPKLVMPQFLPQRHESDITPQGRIVPPAAILFPPRVLDALRLTH